MEGRRQKILRRKMRKVFLMMDKVDSELFGGRDNRALHFLLKASTSLNETIEAFIEFDRKEKEVVTP